MPTQTRLPVDDDNLLGAAVQVCAIAVPEARDELLHHLATRYLRDWNYRCQVDELAWRVSFSLNLRLELREALDQVRGLLYAYV